MTVKAFNRAMLALASCTAVGVVFAQQGQQQGAQQQQQQETQQARAPQQQGQQGQQGEQMAQGRRVIVGQVEDVRDIPIAEGGGEHKLVKVMANEKTVVVDLGPTQEAQLDVQPGDRILAIGNSARIGGRPVIYARYIGELYGNVPLQEEDKLALR